MDLTNTSPINSFFLMWRHIAMIKTDSLFIVLTELCQMMYEYLLVFQYTQSINTLKRLMMQAENDYYALYRYLDSLSFQ